MALERPRVPVGKKGVALGERVASPIPVEEVEGGLVSTGAGAATGVAEPPNLMLSQEYLSSIRH